MKAIQLHRDLTRIWEGEPGWRGVLTSVSHTDLGKRFIIAAAVFFGIGGVLAMLIRAQLATPESAFAGPEVYGQIFTMHGSIMMFLFAIPMLEGLAIYLLPKILGARDLAYPRLTALGWWCYLFGGSIMILALLGGVAPDAGWFLYPPLSGKEFTPGVNSDVWLLGITFVEISAMCAAIEIVVTILKFRAANMSLTRMPIMAWYLLATAGMMIFGFPPLILGSILLASSWAAIGLASVALEGRMDLPGMNVEGTHLPWSVTLGSLGLVAWAGWEIYQEAKRRFHANGSDSDARE